MPFMIRYPALIKPESICKDIICNFDFAATFLDLAGLVQPSYMQGRPFTKLLEGSTPAGWPQVAYHRYWMHRDIFHDARAHYGIRNQRYKLIYWYNQGFGQPGTKIGGEEPKWELFDCDEDPLELVNIYDDAKYTDVVKEMTAVLERKMVEIGDEPEHLSK
jgi:arylsulfatase A-like enzyme